MKQKTIVLAGLVGLLLSARGAMGTLVTVYQQDFASGLGTWSSPDGYAWNGALGNSPGSISLNHVHTTNPGDIVWQYRYAYEGPSNYLTPDPIAAQGNYLGVSYDWYKSTSWTVYPQVALLVTFTDATEQWVYATGTGGEAAGVWNTITYANTFAKPMASVNIWRLGAGVYNNPPGTYIDNELMAFDNINLVLDVPEPSVAGLLVIGGLFLWRRRK